MQNKTPLVVLCSKNSAKISAAYNICSNVLKEFKFSYYDVPSGVSETPDTDEEAIQGCYSRINFVEEKFSTNVDFIIALEGLIEKTSFGSFVYGWAVIKDIKRKEFFYGCSGKVMLPNEVSIKLEKNQKLSEIIRELYPHYPKDELDRIGTNGVLTQKLYTRIDEFETAMKCAFGSVISSTGLYND
ncbi:DUF84 family protein [Xenorhabdus nematophila]|uniref:inosine/xanthosine triphosphatase n=1 Tax=Xenorhabdus nematophila (strain ATCC 19061 / DSM 3370 / CCUG 14189 / LMG 1036 / NCIMB 9965 / AN6) TaxID=406817 RepID=D3VDM5_XENNA|nr:inosine/xanthosine triphosphatase [Xenorhabdus nematophila]CEF28992.1 conserved hypothetical protein [Xenorhabdus nematophila str. Websteri]KHD27548.1 hypothetical protein LH67_17210 [Xenorhabdus nematophila]MBA0020685.1 DUF84 family protein [Xenorhabdus nematophila]MCB4426748.1 DUF84 family protein [Xenorhabdus nematophila]QNJ36338.1 DUF84 family protein [Xenorhabdus nematophila]